MSIPDRTIVVAGLSARALTSAFVARGWRVLACDLFLDQDTVALSSDSMCAPGSLDRGIDANDLPAALRELADRSGALGCYLATASGFEDRPALLDILARDFRLLANGGEVVAAVKDPMGLARALENLGIPHPETRLDRPAEPDGWLWKRSGGSGGFHVLPANTTTANSGGSYFQKHVAGRTISLLFANGSAGFVPIGLSEQWTSAAPDVPYRFGGCVQPAVIDKGTEARLGEWARAAARHFRLRGINSADFMVGDGKAWLIEINPRVGATLDLFANSGPDPVHAHLAAFGLTESRPGLRTGSAAALEILYAKQPIAIPQVVDWPDWIADRPWPNTVIAPGKPVCTVHARAGTRDSAIALLSRRMMDARELFC